jgi:hypothetical protein
LKRLFDPRRNWAVKSLHGIASGEISPRSRQVQLWGIGTEDPQTIHH